VPTLPSRRIGRQQKGEDSACEAPSPPFYGAVYCTFLGQV
ncbi:hypothetical protein HMPREF0262_00688, partial [Clostridium sp. ATCC 29733]